MLQHPSIYETDSAVTAPRCNSLTSHQGDRGQGDYPVQAALDLTKYSI